MSRVVILHDHLNPANEVPVDADAVTAVAAFGSGSSIQVSGLGVVAVHETPHEVRVLIWGAA